MGKIVTIDTEALNISWQPNRQYRIAIDQGFVIEDGNNRSPNPANTNLSTFTTNATGPSISSSTPSDGDTNAISNAVIAIVFNRRIKAGTGDIRLYDSANSVLKTWTPSSGTNLTITDQTLSLSFTGLVIEGGSYYLQADSGSITDRDGFDYAGITNTTDYNWTNSTGPEFPSLAANLSGAFLPTMSVNAQRVGESVLLTSITITINGGKILQGAATMNATSTMAPVSPTFDFSSNMTVTTSQTTTAGFIADPTTSITQSFNLDSFAGFTTMSFARNTSASPQYLYNTNVIGDVKGSSFPAFSSTNTTANGGWAGRQNIMKITPSKSHFSTASSAEILTNANVGTSGKSEVAIFKENAGQTDYEIYATLNTGFNTDTFRYVQSAITDDGKLIAVVQHDRQSISNTYANGDADILIFADYSQTPYSTLSSPVYTTQIPTYPEGGGTWIRTSQWSSDRTYLSTLSLRLSNVADNKVVSMAISGDGKYLAWQNYDRIEIRRRDEVGPNYPTTTDSTYFNRGLFRDGSGERYERPMDDGNVQVTGYNNTSQNIQTDATGTHFLYNNKYNSTVKKNLYILTNTSTSSAANVASFSPSTITVEGEVFDYFIKDNGTEIWLRWEPSDDVLLKYGRNFNETLNQTTPASEAQYISVYKYIGSSWIEAQRIASVKEKATSGAHQYGFQEGTTPFFTGTIQQTSVDDAKIGVAGPNSRDTSTINET